MWHYAHYNKLQTSKHFKFIIFQAAEQACKIGGIEKVLVAECASLKGQIAEAVSAVLLDVQAKNNYTHILANGTVFGKVCLPLINLNISIAMISTKYINEH